MAEKRMFSKLIIDSDNFLDMPLSSQALYFHLNMRADDDGFISSPKRIVKMVNCSDDDMKILLAKQYLIPFETGVVVVKHWKIHNCIQKDRYKETMYLSEKKQLSIIDNSYTRCIQDGYEMDPQIRLDQIRLDQIRIDKNNEQQKEHSEQPILQKTTSKTFKKPTHQEIIQYCTERNNNLNAEYFYDYYEANGWKVGKSPMKDWKATVRNWERNDFNSNSNTKDTKKSKYDSDIKIDLPF